MYFFLCILWIRGTQRAVAGSSDLAPKIIQIFCLGLRVDTDHDGDPLASTAPLNASWTAENASFQSLRQKFVDVTGRNASRSMYGLKQATSRPGMDHAALDLACDK